MPARTVIINKTLRGISEAQKDYECWSGGHWLWEAPEYMITTYIAKVIASETRYYVTLEQGAREGTEYAGGVGKGGVRESTKRKLERGRFDIVVWHGDTPVTIIEVKNQPRGFDKKISDDVDNICRLVKGENSFQYGLIAYYEGWGETTDKESAEDRTSKKVETIRCAAADHIKKEGLKLRQHLSHPKPQVVDDSAWIGVVLKISKK